MEDQNYQTYNETQTPGSEPLYTEQPKKKSNTWWIILLVVLLVLCCCLVIGGVVVFFMLASGQYRIDWSILTPILSFI
jgi:uncharacterized membrane-anchored protein